MHEPLCVRARAPVRTTIKEKKFEIRERTRGLTGESGQSKEEGRNDIIIL